MKIYAPDAYSILSSEIPSNAASAESRTTFKGGLKSIILKYAPPNGIYKPPAIWCKAVIAGVAGVWAGGSAGGKAGAVVFGTAASYAAAGSMLPDVYARMAAMDANAVYANPANNPYDKSTGRRHHRLLKFFMMNNPHGCADDVCTLYDKAALSVNERAFYSHHVYETKQLYEYLRSCSSIQCSKTVLINTIGDSDLLYIINSYIYGVANAASLTDALGITADYECFISSAGVLTAWQKSILMMGFAVARYGFNLWG